MKLLDSITSFVNKLANNRNPMNTNEITHTLMSYNEMRAVYKSGLGSKICRLKAGYALNDTIHFANTDDKEFYRNHLAKQVKRAGKFMIGFGRAVVVIVEKGADLSTPAPKNIDIRNCRLEVISGDLVKPLNVSMDLMSPRYLRPLAYSVRGFTIHHSRIIDFTYVEPPQDDAATYNYGGISEFELIRPQIVADGVVERAVPAILEKNSSFFYKLVGFKNNLMDGQTDAMVEYFRQMENIRSIYGAGLIDADDSVEAINQTLTNLAEADSITLRRLAMVTGIPFIELIGEGPSGLNATGETELSVKQDMVETLQSEYFQDPISELMVKFGRNPIEFKENQGQTPTQRMEFETKAIKNAVDLANMGEDYEEYLERYDIIQKDAMKDFFPDLDDNEGSDLEDLASLIAKVEQQ